MNGREIPPCLRVPGVHRNRLPELLAGLGHEIIDIDYGLASLWNSTVRLLKGVHDDVASMAGRDDLEARTRAVARLGRLIPARSLRAALRREQELAMSINGVFQAADVVLTPLCESSAPRLDRCPTRRASAADRPDARSKRAHLPAHLPGQVAPELCNGPCCISSIGFRGPAVHEVCVRNWAN